MILSAGCQAAQPTVAAETASPLAPAASSSLPAPSGTPASASGKPIVEHGPREKPVIALTFDADMTRAMLARLQAGTVKSWYDARIVALLRRTKTPATIFLTGLWTETYASVVRSLAADPLFELENHSVDHSAWEEPCFGLPEVRSDAAKSAELRDAAATIESVAGVLPRYFRFPGGCHDQADVALAESLGETPVAWDVVSGDPFEPNAAVIVRNVLAGVQPGSIVVMHLMGAPNAPATFSALEQLIPLLHRRGFRFATLRDLLGR